MDKISVIVPVYKTEQYLNRCVQSVTDQTYKNLEIIRQKNSGAGEARNKGIQAAKGEFIAFMDADDWYPSTTILKNLYIAAKRHNVKVCGGSFSSFIKNKTVTEYSDEFAGYTFTENKLMLFS